MLTVHLNAWDEAQIRFMAVDENVRGRGYVWETCSRGIETEAARRCAQKVLLNARDNATEFYSKHGLYGRC